METDSCCAFLEAQGRWPSSTSFFMTLLPLLDLIYSYMAWNRYAHNPSIIRNSSWYELQNLICSQQVACRTRKLGARRCRAMLMCLCWFYNGSTVLWFFNEKNDIIYISSRINFLYDGSVFPFLYFIVLAEEDCWH
jgi:hypothetical protein